MGAPIWSTLGIEPTQDASIIRRAYAAMLKKTRPEDDPEGFVQLRRAYESALAKARTPAISIPTPTPDLVVPPALVELLDGVASPVDAEPRATTASHVAASASDAAADLKTLRVRFAALKSALKAPQSPTSEALRSLLEAFLQSPALEVLTVQMEFEPALARLFLKYPHAFAPLWHVAIDRWQWRDRGRKVRGEIAAVLALADDAKSLHELQQSSPSRVYAAMTQDPDPIRLWIQIVLFRLDQEVSDAMQYWNSPAPAGTDADALAWWRNFFSRPQPRPLLLQVTGLLTVLVLPVAWLATRSLIPGVLVLLVGLGVTLGWWGLVDWPPQRFLEFQNSGPWWLPVGWAPAIVVALTLAALGPDFSPLAWAAMVLTAVGLFWAILTMPGRADFTEYAPLFLAIGLGNVPIVVWWIVVSDTPRVHPTLPMWVTFLGALVTLLFGQPTLWREFQSLTRSFRQTVRAVIAVIALAMAGGTAVQQHPAGVVTVAVGRSIGNRAGPSRGERQPEREAAQGAIGFDPVSVNCFPARGAWMGRARVARAVGRGGLHGRCRVDHGTVSLQRVARLQSFRAVKSMRLRPNKRYGRSYVFRLTHELTRTPGG